MIKNPVQGSKMEISNKRLSTQRQSAQFHPTSCKKKLTGIIPREHHSSNAYSTSIQNMNLHPKLTQITTDQSKNSKYKHINKNLNINLIRLHDSIGQQSIDDGVLSEETRTANPNIQKVQSATCIETSRNDEDIK